MMVADFKTLPTYPSWMCRAPILWLWRKLCCSRRWHLWDGVYSSALGTYLSCDACDATWPPQAADPDYYACDDCSAMFHIDKMHVSADHGVWLCPICAMRRADAKAALREKKDA